MRTGSIVALLIAGCSGSGGFFGHAGGDGGTNGNSDGAGVPAADCPAGSTEGVPVSDRPSYIERLALYAVDRSRVDPAATGWPSFPAVPPLLWHDALAQSARAHSADMRDTPCFQHQSCDGTDPFVRIQTYWTSPAVSLSENIAAGDNDGQQVVQNWIDEVGAPPGETGHRMAIFGPESHYNGLGYAPGGGQFHGYWTEDFAGVDPPPAIARLPAGSHYPESGGAVTFGVVYYDARGVTPASVSVVVDGSATVLARASGSAAAGAYEGRVTLGRGCHRYHFRAVAGTQATCYPGSGTLGVSGGGTVCPEWAPR